MNNTCAPNSTAAGTTQMKKKPTVRLLLGKNNEKDNMKKRYYECSLMNGEFIQEVPLKSDNITFSIGTL